MEIEYKRDLDKSYMCILAEKEFASFEREMLERRTVPGLLSVSVAAKDEKYVFWYDITGKQDLEGILDTKPMNHEMLTQFLAALCSVQEYLESYLLNPAQLLLRQDTIFKSVKEDTFLFCYGADSAAEMTDAFQQLMESLLTKVDHKDAVAVKMAYFVYEQVAKEGYSISAIREGLDFGAGEWEAEPPLQEEVELSAGNGTGENKIMETVEASPPKRLKKAKKSPKTQTLEFLDKICRRLLPDIEKIREYRAAKAKKADLQPIVFEPEEVETKQGEGSRPTVLLGNEKKELSGVFIYEGIRHFENMRVDKTPYIIGSAPDCDAQIDSPTVSRHHARITQKEDLYFIEDLNSANGTLVGGTLLDYKTKVSLQGNETVEFADVKFRFI